MTTTRLFIVAFAAVAVFTATGAESVNIDQLPESSSLANNDWFVIWDQSAPSGSKTRKIGAANVSTFMSGAGAGTVTGVQVVVPPVFTSSSSGTTTIIVTIDEVDQGANKLYYYNNTTDLMDVLGIGSGLAISGGNLVATGGGGSGDGTVTSVGILAPSTMFAVGAPVTTSGNLELSFANVAPNTGWFGPASGGAGITVNRAMVEADVPALAASKITSGVLGTARLGTGTASGSTVLFGDSTWGALPPAGDVASTRQIIAGTGLTGGGDLSADRTLSLDIASLIEDASPNLTDDFAVFYDASGDVIRKTKISNFTEPNSFPTDPNIVALLGWVETDNVKKWMALNSQHFSVTSGTNVNVLLDTTMTNTVNGVGLRPGQDISFNRFMSRDLTEEWNGNSQAEGKDDNTIVKRGDEAVVYMFVFEDTSLVVGNRITFRAHKAFTVTGIKLSLATATSSGIFTVDINENGTTIFSTRPTIDQGEKTSVTAAAAEVISDTEIAADSEMTIDFDVVGTGGAKPTVTIIGR